MGPLEWAVIQADRSQVPARAVSSVRDRPRPLVLMGREHRQDHRRRARERQPVDLVTVGLEYEFLSNQETEV